MLAALEAGDYAQAAVEMMDSRWARQVGSRAEKLKKMMETGEEK
jgi:lysozyme